MELYIKINKLTDYLFKKLDRYDNHYWVEIVYGTKVYKTRHIDFYNRINDVFFICINKNIPYFYISLLRENSVTSLNRNIIYETKVSIYKKSVKTFQTSFVIFDMGNYLYTRDLKILQLEKQNKILQKELKILQLEKQKKYLSNISIPNNNYFSVKNNNFNSKYNKFQNNYNNV